MDTLIGSPAVEGIDTVISDTVEEAERAARGLPSDAVVGDHDSRRRRHRRGPRAPLPARATRWP